MAGPKPEATLADWQEYVQRKLVERGLDDETVQQKFLLLIEEVGELAKALRPGQGIKTSDDSAKFEVECEMADVLFLLMSLSNKLGIDLEQAARAKEGKNDQRSWQ